MLGMACISSIFVLERKSGIKFEVPFLWWTVKEYSFRRSFSLFHVLLWTLLIFSSGLWSVKRRKWVPWR